MKSLGRLCWFSNLLSSWFERVAVAGLLGMVLATCIDVLGAKLFRWPLPGGVAAVYLLQVIVIASALAYTKIDGRHIRLEVFIDILGKRGRACFNSLASLLGLGLFILVGWKSYDYGQILRSAGEVTDAGQIPIYPFALWIMLCCIPISLVLLTELISSLVEVVKK